MAERCRYCGKDVPPGTEVRDYEFDQDGVYCSKECLTNEMKEEEKDNGSDR